MPITEITPEVTKPRRDPNVVRAELMKKEATISLLLQHPRGLDKLAAVLANPVRKHLDYKSIARKLIVTEPMPDGMIPYFDADIEEFTGMKIAEDGTGRFYLIKAERTILEPFEIMSKAKVPFKELRIRKYRVFDRMKQRLKQSMELKEDSIWFAALHSAATLTNSEMQDTTAITRQGITKAQVQIEQHRLEGVNVVLNPQAQGQIRLWDRDAVDEVARIELRRTGLLGTLYGMKFFYTTLIGVGAAATYYSYAYLTAPPEFLAWYPIYADAEVVPADRGDDGLLGLTCYQLVAMVIHNSWAVSRVRFNANS